MSAYASEYPPVEFDTAFKTFFEEFYATSDTADAHEKYVANFTKDATLVMASKKAHGSDGTLCTSTVILATWLIVSRNLGSTQGHVGEGCQ
jgi:hypothetical protein